MNQFSIDTIFIESANKGVGVVNLHTFMFTSNYYFQ